MTPQNALYNRQYALIARRVGQQHSFYRPQSALTPIGVAYLQQMASFNQDYRYGKPNKYGNSAWYGMFDSTLCQVGDVIEGAAGTFFIAALQELLPILAIQCNRTLTISRAGQSAAVGELSYGADTAATETVLMAGWPASVLQGTKGEKNDVGLPGDVRTPWFAILLPAWPGVNLRTSDVITDEIGGRYDISSAELTDLGWRLTAMQVRV
jgi:hypothetical protein